MKNIYVLFALLSCYMFFAQSLPINFEGDVIVTDFVDFDGGTADITSNPSATGINLSGSVGQIIRDGGAIFAGSKIPLTNNLDFSVLTKITMKVYTTAPVGTTVKLKLEGSAPPVEVDAFTTVSGTWETLEWVYLGVDNNLNELVFMFDFGNVGDGSSNSTFYFDDIEQVAGPVPPVPTDLPIDFESGIVDTDFLNFNGSIASIISNPQNNAGNPSATVCQIIRDGGDFWAGSRLYLNTPIDLSANWQISMKVFTNAPVGTRVKLELQNASGSTNLDDLTTVSGQWETLTWNFYGKASIYDRMFIMLDFGKIGDGTDASTFLIDDIQQITGPVIPDPVATTFPIDFESNVVTTDFINEDGGIGEVIANPFIDADNPSATVGKFVRSGGAPWAKTKLALTDFFQDMSTNGAFSMKVYTDAPVGTLLKFKIESNVDSFADERDVFTTVSGGWETYTWDFTNQDNPIYNVVTLMLGYATPNDASPNATFYFDDIMQVSSSLSDGNNQAFLQEAIKLYPNPTTDRLNISTRTQNLKSIVIFDLLGNTVFTSRPNAIKTIIDVSGLAKGFYIARISTAEGTSSIKFIKQ